MTDSTFHLLKLPHIPLTAAVPVLFVLALLVAIRPYTTYRYRRSLSTRWSNDQKTSPPPPIPYSIPFLGHALSFLAPHPGQFWSQLFSWHPRATGACTLLLGGQKTHILYSPAAVQGIFKTRKPGRDDLDRQICEYGLGCPAAEARKYFGFNEGKDDTGMTPKQHQEKINHNYLLEKKSVNELTAKFIRVLESGLATQLPGPEKSKEVNLYAWLQDVMFEASTTAFMGSRILECYPNLRADFFEFDRYLLTMFFRVPKILSPQAYGSRERCLTNLTAWHEKMLSECSDTPCDPDGEEDWEPVYGSRANRARQTYYKNRNLTLHSRASFDLGFLFGLSSNAIPATGWMLMHILNPKSKDPTVYSRVMSEIQAAVLPDGSIDVPTLVSSALLQSILHEVLRLYVDVLVTRELKEDLTLPLDANGNQHVFLDKNSVVIAPSYLGHRDEKLWTDPPCDEFYPERFLSVDESAQTGEGEEPKAVFSTDGTNGKFFPWGGGKTICPGRVFAKQEVLAAVAMVLLTFEFEVEGFVDTKGRKMDRFPGLRPSYQGSGIMSTDEDMKLKIRKRK